MDDIEEKSFAASVIETVKTVVYALLIAEIAIEASLTGHLVFSTLLDPLGLDERQPIDRGFLIRQ